MNENIVGNQVFSQAKKHYWHYWLLALIWNTTLWFAIIMGGDNILKAFDANPIFYFFISFPFIGVWIVILAIKETLAWYKFGKTPIILDPFPGQVGGRCAGYLDLPFSGDKAHQAIVTLTCVHRYRYKDNTERSSWREEPIWQDRVTIKLDRYGQTSRLNFAFHPPENLPVSENENDDYHYWRMQIRLPLPGIDYDRQFIVPLEVADDWALAENERYRHKAIPIVEHRQTEVGTIPQIEKTASGTQFYYGYGRSKATAIILMIFGMAIAVFGYFFFDGFMDFLPITARLMAAFVGLIALAMIIIGIFLVTNSLTVEVGLMGVRKQQRILGLAFEEVVDANHIVDIITEKNASSTSGNTTRVWYSLKLVQSDGQQIEVADSLEGQSYANEIRQHMLSCLGMRWQPARLDVSEPENNLKKPVPVWLKLLGKLVSFSFFIALIVDIGLKSPQITDFITKVIS